MIWKISLLVVAVNNQGRDSGTFQQHGESQTHAASEVPDVAVGWSDASSLGVAYCDTDFSH